MVRMKEYVWFGPFESSEFEIGMEINRNYH